MMDLVAQAEAREEAARHCFVSHDSDNSGNIDVNELLAVLTDLGLKQKGETDDSFKALVARCMREHDANSDGVLSFTEFQRLYNAVKGVSADDMRGERHRNDGHKKTCCLIPIRSFFLGKQLFAGGGLARYGPLPRLLANVCPSRGLSLSRINHTHAHSLSPCPSSPPAPPPSPLPLSLLPPSISKLTAIAYRCFCCRGGAVKYKELMRIQLTGSLKPPGLTLEPLK
jgi:hypothetical protein